MARIIEEVRPSAAAYHVVVYAMSDKGLTEGGGRYGYCYGTIPIHLTKGPLSILAMEMAGASLAFQRSDAGPDWRRSSVSRWASAITGTEFVESITDIGMGMGGWREDQQFYANAAGI